MPNESNEKSQTPLEELLKSESSETLVHFLSEIKNILHMRKGDGESFADVLADYSYDPILRMNRSFEWEKMITFEAWNNPEFKEKLKSPDNEVRKEAIFNLITRGLKFKVPFSKDLTIHVHFNEENVIHIVIPEHETNRPLGY